MIIGTIRGGIYQSRFVNPWMIKEFETISKAKGIAMSGSKMKQGKLKRAVDSLWILKAVVERKVVFGSDDVGSSNEVTVAVIFGGPTGESL